MKQILLVAHEPIISSALKLELAGRYDVLEVASPVEALDVSRAHAIDLLICDAEPGLVSGMELASLLRAWHPRLRTIITTGLPRDYWTGRQRMELGELPEDDVVVLGRPFVSSDLKQALEELLPEEIALATSVG